MQSSRLGSPVPAPHLAEWGTAKPMTGRSALRDGELDHAALAVHPIDGHLDHARAVGDWDDQDLAVDTEPGSTDLLRVYCGE